MAYESDPLTQKLNDLVNGEELYFLLIGFNELTLAEKALIGIWELANEVYNGGFLQYFHNSSGEHAKPMVDVLKAIGSPTTAAILEEALRLAGPGTRWGDEPNYLKAISSMPDDVKDQLRSLERRFFDESDDLHLQVFRYLSTHRGQLDVPEKFWEGAAVQ
jgi:hypothetical protein